MGIAQDYPVALDLNEKLAYAAANSYGPLELLGSAAYAGILQGIGTPAEWGGGAAGYGKRLGSTLAASGIHGVLAFGLDSALHEDPRYFRSRSTGFWNRTGHAVRGTILTRTDAGGETFSVWRFGSAYGEAFLSTNGIQAVSIPYVWDFYKAPCDLGSIWLPTWVPSSGRTSKPKYCGESHDSDHSRPASPPSACDLAGPAPVVGFES
jgi:hypothetical protein